MGDARGGEDIVDGIRCSGYCSVGITVKMSKIFNC